MFFLKKHSYRVSHTGAAPRKNEIHISGTPFVFRFRLLINMFAGAAIRLYLLFIISGQLQIRFRRLLITSIGGWIRRFV